MVIAGVPLRADIAGVAPTVLVAEDDDDVRHLAAVVLREAGYNVLQAMSGEIAVVLLEQAIPIDLLFTDIVMPGDVDGFELARIAVSLRPGLKVIYATGFTGMSRAAAGRLHGQILHKPWRPAQLVDEVAALLVT